MSDKRLSRRDMLEMLLAGVSTGAAWPAIAASHPVRAHVSDLALLDRAETVHSEQAWKPLFLSQVQSDGLTAIAEAMIPGSTQARVARFIDLVLSVDSPTHQKEFATTLSTLEQRAEKDFGRHASALKPTELESLLTAASSESVLREHFQRLKDWIVAAYYSSEQGMRELGWDGNHAFAKFPGCEHAGTHSNH